MNPAAATCLPLPSLAEMGVEASRLWDVAISENPADFSKRRLGHNGGRTVCDRAMALQDLMTTMPAHALADVTAQLALIAFICNDANENELSPVELRRELLRIRRLCLSCYSFVSSVAPLNLRGMVDSERDEGDELFKHFR